MGWKKEQGWKFNVTIKSHRQSFLQFLDFVRTELGVGGVVMQDARRLPPQVDEPQFQDLELSAGESSVTLRLRTDNLYVVGFRNAAGRWFRFRNEPPIARIESEVLPVTGSYTGTKGIGGLTGLHLSNHAVETAVRGLGDYAPSPHRNIELLKTWLRTLIVSFVESSRFTTVATTVAAAMGGTEQVLTNRLILQIGNWASLSTALVQSVNTRVADPGSSSNPPRSLFTQFSQVRDWYIYDETSAAAALGLLLINRLRGGGSRLMRRADAAPAYGVTLLEVLSVEIVNIDGENPGNLYGTVRVRDSFGSVDLFNRERSDIQLVRPREQAKLRWPCRAISAADDLVIDLNLMDRNRYPSLDDEVSRGELVWVSRIAVSSNSDVVRKALVTGKFGSAEVSYAVVTNAVVATMEVLLIDGDGGSVPHVYGTITARTLMGPATGNPLEYDLFWRARSHQIGVPKNSNIPLLRRVITAVWGSPLTVSVDLWDKDSDPSPDDQIAYGSVSFRFKPARLEYSEAIQITGRYGKKVEVRVSWSLSHTNK